MSSKQEKAVFIAGCIAVCFVLVLAAAAIPWESLSLAVTTLALTVGILPIALSLTKSEEDIWRVLFYAGGCSFGLVMILGGIGAYVIIPSQTAPRKVRLADGLVYSRSQFHGCQVHQLTVDLHKIKPVILTAPNTAYAKQPLSTLVAQANASENILAAVNGDFFNEGGAIGPFGESERQVAPHHGWSTLVFAPVSQSKTRSARRNDLLGYKADVEIYRFATTAKVTAYGMRFPLLHTYNTEYIPREVGVYTSQRGEASGAGSCRNLVQARVKLTAGQPGDLRLEGIVTEVVTNPKSNLHPDANHIVIVAGNEDTVPPEKGAYSWGKDYLELGSVVSVYLAMSPAPAPITLSGFPQFMRMGQYIAPEDGNEKLLCRNKARTAVGISGDGRFLCVVAADGAPDLKAHPIKAVWAYVLARSFGLSYLSTGLTMQDLYDYVDGALLYVPGWYLAPPDFPTMKVDSAVNLDGGGSSTMVIAEGGRPRVVNHPKDFEERPIPNGLGFVPINP